MAEKREMGGKNSKEKREDQQTKRAMSRKSSNDERDIALFNAALHGDVRKVEELLSQGGRVDFRNKQGGTPLLVAAQ